MDIKYIYKKRMNNINSQWMKNIRYAREAVLSVIKHKPIDITFVFIIQHDDINAFYDTFVRSGRPLKCDRIIPIDFATAIEFKPPAR